MLDHAVQFLGESEADNHAFYRDRYATLREDQPPGCSPVARALGLAGYLT